MQQSALDEVDTYSPIQKQVRMLELILHFHERARPIIQHGAPIVVIHDLPVMDDLIRMKTQVANDQLEKLDDIRKQLDEQMDKLEKDYR